MTILRRFVLSFLLVSVPFAVRAQTAGPVLDIDPGVPGLGASASPRSLTVVGGKLFFTADEPSSGRELWVTDGTAAGTEMLADICPGDCSSDPVLFGSLGGVLLFADNTSLLWRSDGTRAGTFALPAHAKSLVFLRGAAYFIVCDDSYCSLWRTDGTISGTQVSGGLGANESDDERTFQGPFAAGGKLFVLRWSSLLREYAVWVSDGTYAGTVVAATLPPGAAPRLAMTAAGRLFFFAKQDGEELWTSDGTAAGTKPLTHFPLPSPFGATVALKAGAAGVYFAADDSEHGVDLWRSDGTPAGTVRLTALAPNQPFLPYLDPDQVEEVGGRAVVIAGDDTSGYRLFASSGTPASTVPLGGMDVSPYTGLVRAGGRVFFRADDGVHGYELWSTNGTRAGTAMVRDICPGLCDSQLSRPQALGNGVVFLASDLVHGAQVWTSDGTAAGTRARTALPRGSLSSIGFAAVSLGTRLYFPAADDRGEELWTAGPDAGAGQLVADVAGSGNSAEPRQLVRMGDRLGFTACDGNSREVWVSDGKAGGTIRLSDFQIPESCVDPYDFGQPLDLTTGGGPTAFFWRDWPGHPGLWRTDGTPEGTAEMAEFSFSFGPQPLAVHNGIAFFSGPDGLWRSDGTAAGTGKVYALTSGEAPSMGWIGESFYLSLPQGLYRFDDATEGFVLVSGAPRGARLFTQAGGFFYFFADDAQNTSWLWKSDGTGAGTRSVSPAWGDEMVGFGGGVAFLAGNHELWKSDGTPGGTVLIARLPDGDQNLPPGGLVVAGGLLFFTADDGIHGRELWVSDGTPGGIVMVRDINPGLPSSAPSGLTAFAGRLFFAAYDSIHGRELWMSDGTVAGTHLAQDLAPEEPSSSPAELTVAGDNLFFTADDGLTGREIWMLPSAGIGCQPTSERLCLSGGRFMVTVAWRDFAGRTGAGQAIPLTADTGGFWFFAPSNLELAIKVLDGRGVNGAFWVFYGALSNVEYEITVTDTATGLSRRYQNPRGQLASVGDTRGFGPLGAFSPPPPDQSAVAPERRTAFTAATGPCVPGPRRLCLQGGRYAVEATWEDFAGHTGTGTAVPLSGDTGTFWFFAPGNLEVFTKVLDGHAVNGKVWFFYGALSNVEYTLTVTDTATGAVRTYHNPSGRFGSVADTGAF